ncbi:MAG: DUF4398 domain-containing protein [Pseudomonadota bacterium]
MRQVYVGLLGAVLLSACATSVETPSAFIEARSAIEAADKQDVRTYAPGLLVEARDKLKAAESALENREVAKAKRLSDEAAVSIRLAESKAKLKKSQEAASEIRRSNAVLQSEISN